jgi:tape measure domain-containing protein
MGLSAEDTEGIFLALGQMISKGTVQAEELRGQLGERLPGAFNLAAQAMGVTTAQLDKMLQNGQVVAKDFLPKFANELDKVYSAGVQLGSDGLNANTNRFNSALTNLYKTVGDYLTPAFNGALKAGTGFLNVITGWIGGNKEVKSSTDLAVQAVEQERAELTHLVKAIRNQNISNEARQALLNDLNVKFPTFAKSIDVVKASEKELEKALIGVNRQFDLQVFNTASIEIRKKYSKELGELVNEEYALSLELEKVNAGVGQFKGDSEGVRENIASNIKKLIANIQMRRVTLQKGQEAELGNYKAYLESKGLTEEQANQKSLDDAKSTSNETTEAQRKATEDRVKLQAEWDIRELEARQKLAVAILESKIKSNADLLNEEGLAYPVRLDIIRKGQELELELIQLKNNQAKKQYEVDKSNVVQVKKLTTSELGMIDEQARQEEINAKNKTKNELAKIDKEIVDNIAKRAEEEEKRVEKHQKSLHDIEKHWAELAQEADKSRDEEDTKRLKEKEEIRKSIAQASEQALNEIVSFGFDNKARKLDEELSRLQTQKDYELKLAGENEEKKVAINQNFAEKERQIKQRQAQAEKNRVIFEILLQTSINTVKALGVPPAPNLVLAAIAAGTGAVQLALASARPLPKFNKGTRYVQLNGNPDGVDTVPALVNKGERIVPTAINAKMMGIANEALPAIVALGLQASLPAQDKGVGKEVLVDALKEVFRGLPTDKVVFDKNGFVRYTETARQTIKHLNSDYEI